MKDFHEALQQEMKRETQPYRARKPVEKSMTRHMLNNNRTLGYPQPDDPPRLFHDEHYTGTGSLNSHRAVPPHASDRMESQGKKRPGHTIVGKRNRDAANHRAQRGRAFSPWSG